MIKSKVSKIRGKFHSYLLSRYKAIEEIRKQQHNQELCAYGLASDQSPSSSPKGYWRTFMGVTVPVFTGAERIAKQFNIPIKPPASGQTSRAIISDESSVDSLLPLPNRQTAQQRHPRKSHTLCISLRHRL